MSATRRRMSRRLKERPFELQLTSLMDILCTLMFFLLVHYSAEAPYNPDGDLRLPLSTTRSTAVDALKLVATRKAVALGETRIADIRDDELYDPVTQRKLEAGVVKRLEDQLKMEAAKVKEISKLNPEKKFEGHIILEADATLPYSVIKRLMLTAGRSEFVMFKFAVTRVNE